MTKLENNLTEANGSENLKTAYEYQNHDDSEELDQHISQTTNSSDINRKIKKSVNFEASKQASLDLERIIPDRCKLNFFV